MRGRTKIRAVVDTNVFVSAIFWRGSARECMARFARREFDLIVSEEIVLEYDLTACELKERERRKEDPRPWLQWVKLRGTRTEPALLGKRIAKNPDDQKFIACALSGRADYSVSRDSHLLRLGKPFGIEILEDRDFLARLDRALVR